MLSYWPSVSDNERWLYRQDFARFRLSVLWHLLFWMDSFHNKNTWSLEWEDVLCVRTFTWRSRDEVYIQNINIKLELFVDYFLGWEVMWEIKPEWYLCFMHKQFDTTYINLFLATYWNPLHNFNSKIFVSWYHVFLYLQVRSQLFTQHIMGGRHWYASKWKVMFKPLVNALICGEIWDCCLYWHSKQRKQRTSWFSFSISANSHSPVSIVRKLFFL